MPLNSSFGVMEKRYIFFETGAGLAALAVGAVAAFAVSAFLAVHSPFGALVDGAALLATAILVLFVAFKLDRLSLRRRSKQ